MRRSIAGGRWRSGPFRVKVVDDGKPRELTREAQAEIERLREQEAAKAAQSAEWDRLLRDRN